jgi:hypothetical protein
MNKFGCFVSAIAVLVSASSQAEKAPEGFSMGNGSRKGKVLTFDEVHIDGNGWLVMHPFEEGKPNGDKYVGATYVESGTNKDVEIEVHKGAETGEMFIVMLHRDLNENQIFDFVFVDNTNVMDRAVFEGPRMIGHMIPAP